ncbi:MAG: phosphate ABC transporter substrate-binding protein PstS [Anaerolineae bacterium]|nr:phosphate ABC transporter substrate-binding protein PstS [Chloroflexota bacterium]
MRRSWLLGLVLVALVAGLVGCSQPEPETIVQEVEKPVTVVVEVEKQVTVMPTAAPEEPQAAAGSVQLTGAGASFPYPLYSRWFYEYAFVNAVPRINYQSIGSGGGIRQITEKNVDFAGSDAVLNDEQKAAAPGLMMLPTVAGAVVLAYNVEGADGEPLETGLVLTPEVISGIFLGQITRWNDPQIAASNPDVQLPDAEIVVAHRSDGSGTSFIFTSYLSAVSEEWLSRVGAGTAVEWPVGLGGKGNEGVAGIVKEQPGSIGYVELAYAVQNKLAYAYVQNQAGNVIEPGLESTTAASNEAIADMPEDLGQVLVNAPGADSYPIAGYTFLLVYEDMQDCDKARELQKLITWAMSPEADAFAEELLYAPLGADVKALVQARVDALTCNGQPIVP